MKTIYPSIIRNESDGPQLNNTMEKQEEKEDGMKINVELYYRTECNSEPQFITEDFRSRKLLGYYI
jgi:hypothetical protein